MPGGTYTFSVTAANAAGASAAVEPGDIDVPERMLGRAAQSGRFSGLQDRQHDLRRVGFGCQRPCADRLHVERQRRFCRQLSDDQPDAERDRRAGVVRFECSRHERLRLEPGNAVQTISIP